MYRSHSDFLTVIRMLKLYYPFLPVVSPNILLMEKWSCYWMSHICLILMIEYSLSLTTKHTKYFQLYDLIQNPLCFPQLLCNQEDDKYLSWSWLPIMLYSPIMSDSISPLHHPSALLSAPALLYLSPHSSPPHLVPHPGRTSLTSLNSPCTLSPLAFQKADPPTWTLCSLYYPDPLVNS